ncbi:MAG TPA: nicotinate-nucleotide adenylyltransferase [Thermoanaerobaculia bacterium]|jgi:nicotinate-nucleotide adenylyltransferase|nr:nicotinate-nucleotide adenylyltransferase [Thermoanaerobaculia bacterium]
MNIGICGGTFDPFHRGHLDPIVAVRGEMQWDRVIYVPAFVQPFKQDRETASGHHRFAMAAIATLDRDELLVSSMELERGAVSYTVDTLQQLRNEYPDGTLDWIIGDDNLAKLGEWKSIDTIFEMANFVVLTRGSHEVPASMRERVTEARMRPKHGTIVFAENATVPVSSTEIRRRVHAGEPIEDLVPPPVSRYIHHYDLYRKGHS